MDIVELPGKPTIAYKDREHRLSASIDTAFHLKCSFPGENLNQQLTKKQTASSNVTNNVQSRCFELIAVCGFINGRC